MYSPGKVFVHCAMGISRSGALVLAYLMICQGLSLTEAIVAVRQNRDIGPNSGFLEQLRHLDLSLKTEREREREEITLTENMTMTPAAKCNKGLSQVLHHQK